MFCPDVRFGPGVYPSFGGYHFTLFGMKKWGKVITSLTTPKGTMTLAS
ncbi:hypothetical protein [uncultured Bacteroides sp.]|nr:hypothetical protein [uncultured Bacteroides sp.]